MLFSPAACSLVGRERKFTWKSVIVSIWMMVCLFVYWRRGDTACSRRSEDTLQSLFSFIFKVLGIYSDPPDCLTHLEPVFQL